MKKKLSLELNGQETQIEVDVLEANAEGVRFVWKGKTFEYTLMNQSGPKFFLQERNRNFKVVAQEERIRGEQVYNYYSSLGKVMVLDLAQAGSKLKKKRSEEGDGANLREYISPMPAKIFKVMKKKGESFSQGEVLLILEAMKMEHMIKAQADGVVEDVLVREGQIIAQGDLLYKVVPRPQDPTPRA